MLFGEEQQQQAMFTNVANQPSKVAKTKRLNPEQLAAKRRRLWITMCKKEIPRAAKQKANQRKEGLSNLKKVCVMSLFLFLFLFIDDQTLTVMCCFSIKLH